MDNKLATRLQVVCGTKSKSVDLHGYYSPVEFMKALIVAISEILATAILQSNGTNPKIEVFRLSDSPEKKVEVLAIVIHLEKYGELIARHPHGETQIQEQIAAAIAERAYRNTILVDHKLTVTTH